MTMKSDEYTEIGILNLKHYENVLDINKIIENDFCNLVDNLDIQDTEKETLKSLFYKYGVVSYKMKECE